MRECVSDFAAVYYLTSFNEEKFHRNKRTHVPVKNAHNNYYYYEHNRSKTDLERPLDRHFISKVYDMQYRVIHKRLKHLQKQRNGFIANGALVVFP